MLNLKKKLRWATLWAIFSQTYLVALIAVVAKQAKNNFGEFSAANNWTTMGQGLPDVTFSNQESQFG
jgi:hypothetical protein